MSPRCGVLLSILLGSWEVAAQFPGLANLNPQNIVSQIKSPEELAKQSAKIADQIKGATPAKAVQAIQGEGQQQVAKTLAHAGQAASAIKDAGEEAAAQAASGVVSKVREKAGKGVDVATPTSTTTAATTVAPAREEPAAPRSPQQASVVDALQTVSNTIQRAGGALNGSSTEAALLNGTNPAVVVDALKGAVKNGLPQIKPDDVKKVQQGVQPAIKAIGSTPQVEGLKKAGQGLAGAFGLPGLDNVVHQVMPQIHPEVKKAIDGAVKKTDALQKTDPVKAISDLQKLPQQHTKVVDAIKKGKPGDLLPNSGLPRKRPHKAHEPVDTSKSSSNGAWLGTAIGALLLVAIAAGGWHLFSTWGKQRGVGRSPTLLTDAEMATWTGSGQNCGRQHAEEPLFRQF